jgi:hypothetical protein
MAELSPQAQAVMKAAAAAYWGEGYEVASPALMAAAALQAAADEVISSIPPPCEDFDEYAQGFRAAHVKYRNEFLAIATELEGQP